MEQAAAMGEIKSVIERDSFKDGPLKDVCSRNYFRRDDLKIKVQVEKREDLDIYAGVRAELP
jgi:hypothetical protein